MHLLQEVWKVLAAFVSPLLSFQHIAAGSPPTSCLTTFWVCFKWICSLYGLNSNLCLSGQTCKRLVWDVGTNNTMLTLALICLTSLIKVCPPVRCYPLQLHSACSNQSCGFGFFDLKYNPCFWALLLYCYIQYKTDTTTSMTSTTSTTAILKHGSSGCMQIGTVVYQSFSR